MTSTRPATTALLLHPRLTVVTLSIAGAITLSGCDPAPDVVGVDASPTTGSTETTTAPETTAAPTTAPPTTAASSSDPATLVVDRLFEAFNAQDAEGVAGVFGDDVLYVLHNTGEELVGADAVTFFEGYFGRETGERITDPFQAPDGRTYYLGRFADSYGSSAILVFDVEMDGERLVSMGDRQRRPDEFFAAGAIDRLYEAFNDQDLDRLTEELEGVTYRSPSGEEFIGADAAERWADSFGSVVTRTTGVFAMGEGAYGFVTEHEDPGSDRSTAYTVEVEKSDERITSVTERRLTS